MSALARAEGAKLRQKYARTFDVPLSEVVMEDRGQPDRYFVHAPQRPELPTWDTGEMS